VAPRADSAVAAADSPSVIVRPARPSDAAAITAIDERHTGVAKPEHWAARLAESRSATGVALVAEQDGAVIGYLLGQVRAWEFGSPPAGWIYGVGVDPLVQHGGVGRRLLEAARPLFAELGATSLRTMVQRDSVILQRFFRSAGFVAGPFVELEAEL
jgi:predicted N-acetyltransferase YhbS